MRGSPDNEETQVCVILTVDGDEGLGRGPLPGNVSGDTAVVGGVLQPRLQDQQVARGGHDEVGVAAVSLDGHAVPEH